MTFQYIRYSPAGGGGGGGGGVTSVTASTPLFSSGGDTPNLTIEVANSTQNGYLSSTDWNTFNNKVPVGQGYNVELFTLNSSQIAAKSVTLAKSPTTDGLTRLTVINGPEQAIGVDFIENSGIVSWSGLFLDGVLSVGDKLIITYN